MAVRYEGLDRYPNLELTETILPQGNKEPLHGVLSTLLEWNINDSVDAWEENINDIIYYSYQHNRNSFIDFPRLAEYIWGAEMGSNWTSEEALNTPIFNERSISIYPNPAFNSIHIKGLDSGAEVNIYDAIGRKVLVAQISLNNNSIDVSGLKGVYLIHIIAQEKMITKRVIIK
jgi:hypothetical protein